MKTKDKGFAFNSSFIIPHSSLPLRELEALARALLPVLLALFGARVARHESRVLERGPEVCVELHQSARDAVAHCAGLPRRASARDVDDDVELVCGVGERQGLADDHAQSLIGEVLLEGLAVGLELARARPQVNPRGRSLAPTRPVILYVCHFFLFLNFVYAFCAAAARALRVSGSGRCAACGCSASAGSLRFFASARTRLVFGSLPLHVRQ